LLADWELGGGESLEPMEDMPGEAEAVAPAWDVAATHQRSPARPRDGLSSQVLALHDGFGLEDAGASWSVPVGKSSRDEDGSGARTTKTGREILGSATVAAGPTNRHGARARAEETGRSRGPGSLPRPGDELAGFRIIRELGRGAFARVYLAEEVHLGRRLVAIKVSRPEGDEPQILARLQHTHIVPVHSVCDDPQSGLRILCMPFFGGANLAQVLDAAGGLATTEHAGRSLVEALDQISRSLPALASQATVGPLRPVRSARLDRPQSLPAGSGAPTTASMLSGSLNRAVGVSRLRSFFSRLVGPGLAPSIGTTLAEPDADQHQPARLFLHEASAVQAAVWIVARLAEGLDHAHSRGLLHRDLKPANILLAADGTPMLLDFNLAAENRSESPEGELRRAAVGGTLPYMAPEHLDAFNPHGTTPPEAVDERADIYALGLILFEMLAGEHPFPNPAQGTAVLDAIALLTDSRRCVPSLRARCPQVPWSLDALVAKCLEFDPARRYARARDLAEDLRRFLDNLPMKHGPEPSVRERMGKFARRHPGLCGSTSIALLSLVLLVAMGASAGFGYGLIQELAARVQWRIFDKDFTEIQFLLNTADASNEHLTQGIARAGEALGYLGLSEAKPAPSASWFRRLKAEEQRQFREQLVELIMLEARAQERLAEKRGSERDRRRAILRAIARLDWAERFDTRVPGALFAERARYHAALGEADLARRDRERAAATPPTTCHDWTLLGSSLLAHGDLPAAEDALRHAVYLDETSLWAWFIRGHCHYAQGRFRDAIGDFEACSALGPQFSWTHFNCGLALAKAGRLLDARSAYDRALQIDPQFAEAMVNRALVALELNQLEPALADLTAALDRGCRDLGVLAAWGETLARLGRRDEAERRFAAWLGQHPEDSLLRLARGMTRVRTDPEHARSDFNAVLEADPQHAAAHYGMALLIRASDPRAALRHLDTAIVRDPHLIDAIQLRALVRARLGDRAALDDVDRLIETPTAVRLYNAACAVALYAEHARDDRPLPHALELLARALKAGFPPAEAAADPDLKILQALPEFRQLLGRAPKAP
ncbi:MAG TPA: protein kinase, partial [Isosphaeraceae bacterium]|nr:protein kinase [Isosphaeraceae bacterium]